MKVVIALPVHNEERMLSASVKKIIEFLTQHPHEMSWFLFIIILQAMATTYDAILVLGISTNEKFFAGRVDAAIKLYKGGVSKRIIFSGKYWGGLRRKPKKTEAEAMRDYAIRNGIPPHAIYVEEKSLNTIGNFYFARKNILEKNNIRSLIAVTQKSHMPKAKFLAKKILGPRYSIRWAVVQNTDTGLPEGHVGIGRIRKILDCIKDGDKKAIQKLLTAHPYYRGYRNI